MFQEFIMGSNKVVDKNMRVAVAEIDGITFYSPDADFFELNGFYWRKKGGPYRRMPVRSEEYPLTDAVDSLADMSAGGKLRFRSDAARIVVRVKVAIAHKIVRSALTSTMGFDLYVGEGRNAIFRKVSVFDTDTMEYTAELWNCAEVKMRSFSINFPLFAQIESVEFGFNDDAKIELPNPQNDKYIVAYGTSILHGACANRPGNAYTAILSRYFNCPVLNLGFAGNAKGEAFMSKAMSEVKEAGLFILDYDANVDAEILSNTLDPFVAKLRTTHPETPILLVSCLPFVKDVAEDGSYYSERLQELDSIHRGVMEKYRALGDKNIHFISGSTLLGDDPLASSEDGVHPTDHGFALMAAGIAKKIESFRNP